MFVRQQNCLNNKVLRTKPTNYQIMTWGIVCTAKNSVRLTLGECEINVRSKMCLREFEEKGKCVFKYHYPLSSYAEKTSDPDSVTAADPLFQNAASSSFFSSPPPSDDKVGNVNSVRGDSFCSRATLERARRLSGCFRIASASTSLTSSSSPSTLSGVASVSSTFRSSAPSSLILTQPSSPDTMRVRWRPRSRSGEASSWGEREPTDELPDADADAGDAEGPVPAPRGPDPVIGEEEPGKSSERRFGGGGAWP
jgi:hypothetical protein